MMIVVIVGCLILFFGAVVFRGAPYVPTHRQTILYALDMLPLEPGDTIVDLGSGDGSVLLAAAHRGYRAVGYELNPILCAIAWLRTWRERPNIQINMNDYWLAHWPPHTKAVFVFLAGPYMQKLRRKLDIEMTRRSEPLVVVSNGFAIPGILPQKVQHGLYVYKLLPR